MTNHWWVNKNIRWTNGHYECESDDEKDFLTAYDPSKFPITVVTVDLAVFRVNPEDHYAYDVLLVKRNGFPYRDYWALPGGFINPDETTREAAERELREETGITAIRYAHFVEVLDAPDRDPRGRAISHLFAAWGTGAPEGLDDASEAVWWPLTEAVALTLAFDHNDALRAATRKMLL